MKRSLAILISFAMLLSVMAGMFSFSLTSLAVETDYGTATQVVINNGAGEVLLNIANTSLACGAGTASFDAATGTLTLTNATIGGYISAQSGWGALTVVLNGNNTIQGNAGESKFSIRGWDGLTIQGSGSLTVSNPLQYVIGSMCGDLKILGGTITVNGGNDVFHLGGEGDGTAAIVFGGSANVTSTDASNYAVRNQQADGDIIFQDSVVAKFTSSADQTAGEDAYLVYNQLGGDIIFRDNCNVTVESVNCFAAIGASKLSDLAATGNLATLIMEGGTVYATNTVSKASFRSAISARAARVTGGEMYLTAMFDGDGSIAGNGAISALDVVGCGHSDSTLGRTVGTSYFGGGTINISVDSAGSRAYGFFLKDQERVLFDGTDVNAEVFASSDAAGGAGVVGIQQSGDTVSHDGTSNTAMPKCSSSFQHGNFEVFGNVPFVCQDAGYIMFSGASIVGSGSYFAFGQEYTHMYGGPIDFYASISVTSNTGVTVEGPRSQDGGSMSGWGDAAGNLSVTGKPILYLNGSTVSNGYNSGGVRWDADNLTVYLTNATVTTLKSEVPIRIVNSGNSTIGTGSAAQALYSAPRNHSQAIAYGDDFEMAACIVEGTGTLTVNGGAYATMADHGGIVIAGSLTYNAQTTGANAIHIPANTRDGFVTVAESATLNLVAHGRGIYLNCESPSVRVKDNAKLIGSDDATSDAPALIYLVTSMRYAGEGALATVEVSGNGKIITTSTVKTRTIGFSREGASINALGRIQVSDNGEITTGNTGVAIDISTTRGEIVMTGGKLTVSGATSRPLALGVGSGYDSMILNLSGGVLELKNFSADYALYSTATRCEMNLSGDAQYLVHDGGSAYGIRFQKNAAGTIAKVTMTDNSLMSINGGWDSVHLYSDLNYFEMSGNAVANLSNNGNIGLYYDLSGGSCTTKVASLSLTDEAVLNITACGRGVYVERPITGTFTFSGNSQMNISNTSSHCFRMDPGSGGVGTFTIEDSAAVNLSNPGYGNSGTDANGLHIYSNHSTLNVKDSASLQITDAPKMGIYLDGETGTGIAEMNVTDHASVFVAARSTANTESKPILVSGNGNAFFNCTTDSTVTAASTNASWGAALYVRSRNGGTVHGLIENGTVVLTNISTVSGVMPLGIQLEQNTTDAGEFVIGKGASVSIDVENTTGSECRGAGIMVGRNVTLSVEKDASVTVDVFGDKTVNAAAGGSGVLLNSGNFVIRDNAQVALSASGTFLAPLMARNQFTESSSVTVRDTASITLDGGLNSAIFVGYDSDTCGTDLTVSILGGTFVANSVKLKSVYNASLNANINVNADQVTYKTGSSAAAASAAASFDAAAAYNKCVAVSVNDTKVVVEADDTVTTAERANAFEIAGVQIRTEAPAGIRYVARITEAMVENLKAIVGSDDVTYGILLQQAAYADEDLTLDDVVVGSSLAAGSAAAIPGAYSFEDHAGYTYFTAVIINMPTSYYNTAIVARAYVTVGGTTFYATETGGFSVPGAEVVANGYSVSLSNVASYLGIDTATLAN